MPILYPQEPCTIEITNHRIDRNKATCIIKAFDRQHANRDLIEDLKWLNHNLDQVIQQERSTLPTTTNTTFTTSSCSSDSSDSSSTPDGDEQVEEEEEEEEEKENQSVDTAKSSPSFNNDNITTHIRLSDPKLEKISLFHCELLNLMVKCNQCNDIINVKLLANQAEEQQLDCLTCHQKLKAEFISDFVHQGTVSLGTLRLTGCVAYDMLASQFKATCGQCMADLNELIVIAPHDLPQITHCQSCQSKTTAKLHDFQFMQIKSRDEGLFFDDPLTMMLLSRKKDTDDSEPLSEQGVCRHDQSKHWFRFNCCKKVYPCVECHDGHEQHLSDIPTHSICGQCSREHVLIRSGKPSTCCEHVVSKEVEGVRKLDPMHRQVLV
jgi:uncharacterized CHY-type Zn-finger protein/ribosomal protein L12E/L44/L45/RPP1/RPP2